MRRSHTSIKWKIFIVFLVFAIVLLGVLWFFQVVYLNDFYKYIKKIETESVIDQIEEVLIKEEDCASEIEKIAARKNLGVFITDSAGNKIYNAEYIFNSQISSMPSYMFTLFYEEARSNGGEAVIEYKGNRMMNLYLSGKAAAKEAESEADSTSSASLKMEDVARPQDILDEAGIPNNSPVNQGTGKVGYTEPYDQPQHEFMQNLGNDMAESVIYVRIIYVDGVENVLMVNSVLTPVDSTVSTLKTQLVVISFIIAILAFGLAAMLSRSVSKSIIRLNDRAKKLAAGDYNVKFDSVDYAEVAQLSDTLNFAATELGKTDELQKELIANVSHDLRTPLTMIKGYAEVMRDIPGENTPENVQVVIDETERLTDLVNDMLDISRLKAGTITIDPEEYNFTASVRYVLERYNKLREVDGYTINFLYDEEVYVYADEKKMYQVLYNLVNNAINYTGEDKTVTVRQIVDGDIMRIEVTDTGKGVSPEDIPYVWDRYYKDKSAHKRAIQGTGLGLSIVKSVLELHGAKYGVSSLKNHGATFWFELKIDQDYSEE
ncbi:MAG: HAMP domain-containing histidine kinase [Pseudobutyrivibrio sp.]|nr:HAMP domain-containing histidine kinase [Pseudobutyrivibrio sp.]